MKFSSPSFCIITPISYLQYVDMSDTHLVLAHLVDKSEEYANFYKTLEQNHKFIMMDNSAYELKEPYSPDKLIDLGHKCGADAIVLPDYPFQAGSKTIEAAEKFIPLFKEAGFKTFFVPQSQVGDIDDYIETYAWAAQNEDVDIIGMSILGIPNALPNIHPSFARVVMTQLLIDRGIFCFKKHHHYLGLNSGPNLEIPSLVRMNALDTVDSSNPVWTAILGHEYCLNTDSYLSVSKPTMPVDFNIKVSKDMETHTRILHNITLTLELFNDCLNPRVWYAEE